MMRPHPAWAEELLDGTYTYRTRVRLDSASVAGDAVTVDVVDGTYRENAAGIPQVTLDATLYADDTPQLPDLLQANDVRVRVTAIMRSPRGDETEIDLVPMWLERVVYETTGAGREVRIEAVCILGRCSNNQLQGPKQPGGTVKNVVTTLLNASGHPQTITVNGLAGPTIDRDVYDGDGAQAAVEAADHADALIRVDDENTVTLIDTPGAPVDPFLIASPVRYTVVQQRGPSKVIVQGENGRQVAGGAGGARYGTVTRTFTRTHARGAKGLLRRTGGLRSVLTDVELLPAPFLQLYDSVKVRGDNAPNARIWALDLPLTPGPMRLTLRTPEDVT